MTKKHMRWGWLFVSPYIISLLCFTLIPLLVSIFVAFTRYDMVNPPRWVGLQNFVQTVTEPKTWRAFRNIWIYALLIQGLDISISMVLAVLLNQKVKGLSFFRVVYYMPVLTPGVAVSLVWKRLYNPSGGALNKILSFVGLGPFMFTFSKNWFEVIVSIMFMSLWKGLGGTTVYFLAGLQAISNDVIEAANIDGAGAVKKFFKITVPLLTPTIFFMLITGIAASLQTFENFYLMLEETGADVEVVNFRLYSLMWGNSQVGLASSLGWVSFVFIAIITVLQKKFEKKWVHYDA